MGDAIDFATLRRPSTPNSHLALPEGFASTAQADRVSPVFPVSADRLEELVLEVAAAEPRTRHTSNDAARRQHSFVQRTRIFRFPDDVTIQVVDAGQGKASLAIDSRARYGISDFGVNEARVSRWFDAIERRIEGGKSPTA